VSEQSIEQLLIEKLEAKAKASTDSLEADFYYQCASAIQLGLEAFHRLSAELRTRDREIERMQSLLGKAALGPSFREQIDDGTFSRNQRS